MRKIIKNIIARADSLKATLRQNYSILQMFIKFSKQTNITDYLREVPGTLINKLPASSNEIGMKKNFLQVLLVEDDPLIQRIHKDMLIKLECLVDVAGSAEDALVMLRNNHYDLILLDINLPGISGIEMIAEFYQYKDSPRTQAIALTTCSDNYTMKKCLVVGIKKVLHKPIGIKEMAKIIIAIKE